MRQTEHVAVVLPTYNRATTLRRAIDSVLEQTHENLSLLVIDDASTDDTRTLVSHVTDPRLRYIRLDANGGAAHARNVGLRACDAQWVAFQDSDDAWLPTKLEEQLAKAQQLADDVALVLGGYQVASAGGLVDVVPRSTLAGADPLIDLLSGAPAITPTWLARRGALLELGGFDETLPCMEDWDLIFRVAGRFRIDAVRGPVLVKHHSADSVFSSLEARRVGLGEVLARHGHRWQGQRRRYAGLLAHLGCIEARTGHRSRALVRLVRAITIDPGRLRHYGTLLAVARGGASVERAERRWPWDALAP